MESSNHVHRFRIAERVLGQRFSQGRCDCGDTREYDNWSVEDRGYSWIEWGERAKEVAGARPRVR